MILNRMMMIAVIAAIVGAIANQIKLLPLWQEPYHDCQIDSYFEKVTQMAQYLHTQEKS